MIPIDPKKLETAFVRPDTPMLSDVIDKVLSDLGLTPTKRRDIVSGLRRTCEALGLPPQDVPADAAWLQPRVARIMPAALGLSDKTWSNIQSNARAGLVKFGVVQKRISRKTDLAPEWRTLWEIVLGSGDKSLPFSLSRFIHFLNRLGVEPEAVGDEHAAAYREALALNELRRSPDASMRAATRAWNLAVRRVPEWPRQSLNVPSLLRTIRIDPEKFPAKFREDLERYLHDLAHPDPLDERARLKPLRPTSIAQYRTMLLRFASELVHAGMDIAEIDSLAVVVQPQNAERGLRRMLSRTSNKPTPGTADMACLLASVGRSHVKLIEPEQQRLERLELRLSGKSSPGLTRKNRERLRPFDDPGTVRRFLLLPEQLFARAETAKTQGQAVRLREEAIAIAILQALPIRRENLGKIHLEANLQRMGDGRVFLVFHEERVKNSRAIEFELPPGVLAMIAAHAATRAPEACPPGTLWLFPRRDGSGPIRLTYLATRVKDRIAKEIGLKVNMHLFRHIAAKILLEDRPGQYEVVRRLLGLSSLSQTLSYYAGFESGTATRLFADILEKARRG
jgi:integrase